MRTFIAIYKDEVTTEAWLDYCDMFDLCTGADYIEIGFDTKDIKANFFNSGAIDWLRNQEDTCWGKTEEEVLNIAKEYQEANGRVFDREWAIDNIQIIDGYYYLKGYSDAWKEKEDK